MKTSNLQRVSPPVQVEVPKSHEWATCPRVGNPNKPRRGGIYFSLGREPQDWMYKKTVSPGGATDSANRAIREVRAQSSVAPPGLGIFLPLFLGLTPQATIYRRSAAFFLRICLGQE